jgi:hypothetical protein
MSECVFARQSHGDAAPSNIVDRVKKYLTLTLSKSRADFSAKNVKSSSCSSIYYNATNHMYLNLV